MLLCPHCQDKLTALAILNSVSREVDFFLCVACSKVSERPKGSNGRPVPLFVTGREPRREPRAFVH